eukprot:scaffold204352_cov17-Tisochrysis_lutea.AAC.1
MIKPNKDRYAAQQLSVGTLLHGQYQCKSRCDRKCFCHKLVDWEGETCGQVLPVGRWLSNRDTYVPDESWASKKGERVQWTESTNANCCLPDK